MLKGKVGIVTGGCSGIGYAIAVDFLKEGANVVVADYNEKGEEIVKNMGYGEDRVRFVRTDVSKEEQVKNLVEFTEKTFGKVDIAVANAGIAGNGTILDQKLDDWHKSLSVDLDGVLLTDKYAINSMLAKGIKGSIINISSIYGMVGFAGDITYNSAKAAVINLTRSAALMVAEKGIRVNVVAPGYIQTPILDLIPSEEAVQAAKNLHPVKRFGTPEEIAYVVSFLASEKSTFITGATIPVDGGFTAQ